MPDNIMTALDSPKPRRTIYDKVCGETKLQNLSTKLDINFPLNIRLDSGTKPDAWRPNYYPIPTKKLKQYIRERDNYICQLCGKPSSKHVDHIIPLVKSHNNSPENLRVLCHRCNVLSGNRFCKPRSPREPVDNTFFWEAIKRELRTHQMPMRLDI